MSCSGTWAASGPAQNCAGVTPVSRAALSTRAVLRPDLRLDITAAAADPAALTAAVSAHLDAFTEGMLP
jgi:hypothetical protein